MSGLVIALIVLAVVFGVVGLLVEALQWLLIIGVVLLLIGLFRAFMSGRSSGRRSTSA